MILCGVMQLVCGQSYTWRNVEIGGGGFVTGTVFHPAEAGLVYARTDVGGAYRLDVPSQRWIALNDGIGGTNNEFQHLGVQSIGLDPSDPNRVYIATGQYAGTETWKLTSRIYRSTDRGATWTYTTPGFKMAGNGEGRGTGERLVVDPLNGANLLVGSNNLGIWRSQDHGATWARLNSFPSTLTNLNFLIYAPASAPGPGPQRRVYAAANTLTGQSFWYSDDNGTQWSEVPNHPGKAMGAEMMPLQGSFDAAGVFYSTWGDATGPGSYANDYGVWKCSADGNTWTSILPPTGQGFFGGISADPRNAGHVVVSTLLRWWPGDEIYRSTDGGSTWTAALRSGTRAAGNSPWASSLSPHWITDIDIDPFDSNRAIFNTGGGLFQTTNLATSGTARTWTFFNDGLEELVPLGLLSPTGGPQLVSVTGDYTGWRHDDLGRSPLRGRHQPSNGSNSIISGADLAPAKMIRQTSGSTHVSHDAAATWSTFPTTPPAVVNGHHRVIFSTDGQTLIWCPPNAAAHLSNDHGNTWTASESGRSAVSSTGTHNVSTLAGSAGIPGSTNATGGDARFQSPGAIAIDRAGIRYVADTANHLIRRIVANGGVNTLAGSAGLSGSTDATGGNARFHSPAGIAVDGSQNVFVADTANHTIRKISPSGVVSTFAGSAGVLGATDATGTAARFQFPAGLAADASGNLYVCDTGNHSIRKITPTGQVTTIAASFNSPTDLCLDAAGNLFVADSGNHAIRKISPSGEVSTFVGLAGSTGSADGTGTTARFLFPKAIEIDAAGILFVADSGNHCVRKITPNGVVSSIAGLAGSSGSAGGTGNIARFSNPSGIAITPDGFNLYIADTGNHTIRRSNPFNTLTPIADRVDSQRLYLWDGTAKRLLTSSDGGANFTVIASGVNSAFNQFRTAPGKNGHIWAKAGASGLYQSTNFGASFTKIAAVAEVHQFDFGKAAPGASHPAVFIWGKIGSITGFFRSDDAGATWVRINDNLHQFGYQNDIAGDPRVYGRLYLGTSGRGVVYGDIANPVTAPSQATQLVFDDALQSGWANASPVDTSLTSTQPVYRGSHAIAVPAGTGKGLSLSCSARSLQGFAAISFWLNAGANSPPLLQVGISRGGIALEAIPIPTAATIGWQRVEIPFTSIGISGIEDLSGLRIESRSGPSGTPGAFTIDDLTLVGADDFNGGPSLATVSLSNLNQTYDGNPRPVTVTTQPANLPVLVTYNGANTVPTAAGSYTVTAVVNDPITSGSASGTLVIEKAAASINLGNLIVTADGSPKSVSATTQPAGLALAITYNGSPTVPTYAGSYVISAVITDPNYQGSATGTFIIRQPALASTDLNGWTSNISGKVTGGTSSSPLLNPNDTTDPFSTNTLQAPFSPITLVNPGDTVSLTGSFQLSTAGISNQSNWFRFGLFDNRGQAPAIATGWLGYTGMGNSLYERSADGMFSTGTGATQRSPDANPAPVSSTSPSGTPTIAFEQSITRTSNGIVSVHTLRRTDTQAVLMRYSYTDASPNNNGVLTGANNAGTGYNPTYAIAGFAFARNYISTTGAQAQFSDIRISFSPGITAEPQFITFPDLPDVIATAPPITLDATSSSGLPVSFSLVSGPASLAGNILTVSGIGSVTVRASQAGNLHFLPAADVEQTFNIAKAPALITLGDLSAVYDGEQKSASATTDPAGKTVLLTYDGSSNPPTAAGSYQVVATIDDPTYQGSVEGTLVIAPAPQTIQFGSLPDRTFGDAPISLAASASSGLPVSFNIVSGPATLVGNQMTLEGAGTVLVRASQAGDANHLAASPVDQSFTIAKAAASITLGGLSHAYDGRPKPVIVTTFPANLQVLVTYNGTPTAPFAPGSYAVVAVVEDADYTGTSSGTLVIGNRGYTLDLTGWTSTTSTLSGADTSSPLWNPGNTNSGLSGSAHAFFPDVSLTGIGDSLQLTGSVSVTVNNNSRPAGNQSLWFRFGLFRHQTPVVPPAAPVTNNWLGYCGMASGGAALYERTGTGAYASSFTGATARTPQVSQTGATSSNSSITLHLTETITRTLNGIDVSFEAINAATSAKVMSFTYSDSTPNNNGILGGAQNTALNPVHSPTFSAAGFGFSGEYIGTSNAAAQFTNMRVRFSSPSPGATQTIAFSPLADRHYDSAPISLSASASSGLPVSFTIVSGPAIVSGSTLILNGVCEVIVQADQAGDFTWRPADPVQQSFTVSKAPATVTLGNLVHTFDGLVKSPDITTSPTGLAVETTYSGETNAPYQVGEYEVSAVISDDLYEGSASGTLIIANAYSALESWRFEHFGTYDDAGNAANGADPDHDGLENLVEFALALNPTNPSILPASMAIQSGQMEYTYTRSKAALGLVNFSVEWTDSLEDGTWTSAGVTELAPPISDDGTRQTVKVVLATASSRRFCRLKLTLLQ